VGNLRYSPAIAVADFGVEVVGEGEGTTHEERAPLGAAAGLIWIAEGVEEIDTDVGISFNSANIRDCHGTFCNICSGCCGGCGEGLRVGRCCERCWKLGRVSVLFEMWLKEGIVPWMLL